MVHFDAFWNMFILSVCLIIENHWKYLTLEWIGIEQLEAAIYLKNVHLKHQMGQFFKSTVASHAETSSAGRMLCTPAVENQEFTQT